MLNQAIHSLSSYLVLMHEALRRPQSGRLFRRQLGKGLCDLGLASIPLVLIVSLFIGALLVLLIWLNFNSPFLPRFAIGYATRKMILLELITLICVVMAVKMGSDIASEIGTMRVTGQIDALEVMGVNAAGYLILPRLTALVVFMPVIVAFSLTGAVVGAYALCHITHIIPTDTLQVGMQYEFIEWYVWAALIKAIVYAFIIASVCSWFGFNVKNGPNAVGKSCTNAVVNSCIFILFSDILLTALLIG